MSNELFDTITPLAFEEYKEVQQSGVVNMADYQGVKYSSNLLGHDELPYLTRAEYYLILNNYDVLQKRNEEG